jgi:hypothetical protein
MSLAAVRFSSTVALQIASSVMRLLGTRIASALFVSATGAARCAGACLCLALALALTLSFIGRVLLRLLVHSIGGPFALIPTSVLSSAVAAVVPSPLVLLQGVRAGARVAYVLFETPIADGAKRLLVRVRDLRNRRTAAPEQRAHWLTGSEPPPILESYAPKEPRLRVQPSESARSVAGSDGSDVGEGGEVAASTVVVDLDERGLDVLERG